MQSDGLRYLLTDPPDSSVCRCTEHCVILNLSPGKQSCKFAEGSGAVQQLVRSPAAHPELCVCATSTGGERTMGLSMMPRRKSRSMSLAPVEVGSSPTLSNTCCMAGRAGRGTKMQTETKTGRDKRVQSARCESHTNHKHKDNSVTYTALQRPQHVFVSYVSAYL